PKRQQCPCQTDQRHQPRTDRVDQAQHLVVGNKTLLASATIIVRPRDVQRPVHRQDPPPLIGMKLGGIATVPAGDAAPYIPLFFRLATLACRTSLANFCPASRNSKSMAPNSSASGTSTARSTILRTSASILGRSSFRMASIRCSRVSLAAEGRACTDMANSLGEATRWISSPPPRLPRHPAFSHQSKSCTPLRCCPEGISLH